MPRRRRKSQKPLEHHILYEYDGVKHKQQPLTAWIYPVEHYLCTLLQRRGSLVSKGFLRVLEHFIFVHREDAHVLSGKRNVTIEKTKGKE